MLSWSSRKSVATNAVRNRLSKTVQTVQATSNINANPAVLAGFFRPCAKARSLGKPLFGLPKNVPCSGARILEDAQMEFKIRHLKSPGFLQAHLLPHHDVAHTNEDEAFEAMAFPKMIKFADGVQKLAQ